MGSEMCIRDSSKGFLVGTHEQFALIFLLETDQVGHATITEYYFQTLRRQGNKMSLKKII